ncbi:hypothetical protein DAPPUDRAFT_310786 [Daphnia pulex]|uniref:Uncharacterized protein n=1 Tax=Daphnia pulex TaxID=6669 RepID=E9FVI6_DAPPU|nr:hypothetical protein DAPPUDRAFT_310786 [Daphnia pulex]|eukprot:EFX89097.1 hypothetical protein DAPPUDRAFT_310786 [Daphnia pulex]
MGCLKAFSNFLFWYDTPKVVHIRSKKVGILGRFLQLCVLSYIVGYVMVYKNGYQKFADVESSVVTKVRGSVAFTNSTNKNIPDIYRRIWDTSDLIVPPSENNAFFITTNIIITPNQTRGACSEDPDLYGALCDSPRNCIRGQSLPIGNGAMTGRCIPSDANSSVNVCEIFAWCPIEQDIFPLGTDRPLLEETADFTVLIKNFIEFPTFGKTFRRRNIMEDANKTYLQSCHYNQERDPFCPVFRIEDIVSLAGENFTQLAIRGGVIVISIDWNCNLDLDFLEFCKPIYSFRRADDPNTNIAPGWNFRHANYHEENRRTLSKSYGIRFIIDVRGQGRKFDFLTTMLNIGSGISLFGVTIVVCDFIILYISKKRTYYKGVKYLFADVVNEKFMGF